MFRGIINRLRNVHAAYRYGGLKNVCQFIRGEGIWLSGPIYRDPDDPVMIIGNLASAFATHDVSRRLTISVDEAYTMLADRAGNARSDEIGRGLAKTHEALRNGRASIVETGRAEAGHWHPIRIRVSATKSGFVLTKLNRAEDHVDP